LPENVITQKLTAQGFSISTEIVSQNNLIQASDLWNFGNEGLRNFIFPHIEKLI
jgi:hypothetical protein